MWAAMSIIRDIMYGAVRQGAGLAELCRHVGLTPEELAQPDRRVELVQAQRVWEWAVRLTGDERLGLHIGEHSTPTIVGLVGHLMQSSPDLQTAFENLSRFNGLVTEMFAWRAEVTSDGFALTFEPVAAWQANHPHTARQAVEQAMSGSLHVCKLLTGRSLSPVRAEFTRDRPPDIREYKRVLKGDLLFGQARNRLVFPAADARLPVIGYNRELLHWFGQLAEGMRQKAEREESTTQAVKKFLVENFRGQLPALPETAAAFHTTARSLQRRLKDEATSFGDIRDQIRQELAAGLLESHKFTVSEIAYMLGYAGPASFRRAFKRWEGINPGQYGE